CPRGRSRGDAGRRGARRVWSLSASPRAAAGPRMRARMEHIDRAEHKRVDRRTFVKGGLAAGGVLGAGLAIRAVADAMSDSGPPPSTSSPPPIVRAGPSASQGRPNILVI